MNDAVCKCGYLRLGIGGGTACVSVPCPQCGETVTVVGPDAARDVTTPATPRPCTCTVDTLLRSGCRCGGV